MNIPSISVNTMVDRLGKLYANAIAGGMPLKNIPSVFLWGPPGVGKSEGVRQIAENIRQRTGKQVHVTDVRLLLFSPVDLRGVPMADKRREFTEWLRPKIFDLDASSDVINILFLDELSSAPQSVQATAYQITLDRTVGEHRLPDNTIVIAAGNRTTDRSVAFRMPNALANRMMHFEIKVDFASWRSWAIRHDIHPLVVGYLSFDPSRLYAETTDKNDVAYPTPRSWTFVSQMLTSMHVDEQSGISEDLHYLIAGCIGIGNALEFEGWCNVYRELPSAEDIFKGKQAAYPRKPDVLYALISSMTFYASTHPLLPQGQLENACRFTEKFPMDYRTVFYRGLLEIDGMNLRLMKVPSFRSWASENPREVTENG